MGGRVGVVRDVAGGLLQGERMERREGHRAQLWRGKGDSKGDPAGKIEDALFD
jgi:hypothetical protein